MPFVANPQRSQLARTNAQTKVPPSTPSAAAAPLPPGRGEVNVNESDGFIQRLHVHVTHAMHACKESTIITIAGARGNTECVHACMHACMRSMHQRLCAPSSLPTYPRPGTSCTCAAI